VVVIAELRQRVGAQDQDVAVPVPGQPRGPLPTRARYSSSVMAGLISISSGSGPRMTKSGKPSAMRRCGGWATITSAPGSSSSAGPSHAGEAPLVERCYMSMYLKRSLQLLLTFLLTWQIGLRGPVGVGFDTCVTCLVAPKSLDVGRAGLWAGHRTKRRHRVAVPGPERLIPARNQVVCRIGSL
jgi:hypothetical protein